MATMTMTISSPEWTIEGMTAGWADEETPEVARAAADQQYAWLILNTNRYLRERNSDLRGWSFDGTTGSFSGPATNWSGVPDTIEGLMMVATDYVCEIIDDIRKEVAEQG